MINIYGCLVDSDDLLCELESRLRKTFAGEKDHSVQILSSEKGLLFEIAAVIPKSKAIYSDIHVVKEDVFHFIQHLMELDTTTLITDCFTIIEKVLLENDKPISIVNVTAVEGSHSLIAYPDLLIVFVKSSMSDPTSVN